MDSRIFLQTHDYALIDRYALGGNLPASWNMLPIVPTGMEADADKFPALMPLASLGEDERSALWDELERARAQKEALPIVSLLKSAADVQQMHAHWKKQLIIRPPGGGKFHLRSYAPRVLTQLQRIYTPAQLKALFGCVSEWSIYCDQNWHTLAAPACAPAMVRFCNRQQTEKLHRVQAVNRTLAQLPPSLRPCYTPATSEYFVASEKIDALLVRAKNHALAREDEQVQFALHGMTIHPQFDAHPRIKTMLAEMNKEEQTYVDAAALLQAEDWQRIRTELDAH